MNYRTMGIGICLLWGVSPTPASEPAQRNQIELMEVAGVCPDGVPVYEGGGFALQINSLMDSSDFQTMNLAYILRDGAPASPTTGPVTTGLDQINPPFAPLLITYWDPAAGEAGTWELCFIATSIQGDADTICATVQVKAPDIDHVAWASRIILFNFGAGPFDFDLQVSTYHSWESTLSIVMPFLLWEAASTAFLDQPFTFGDYTPAQEYVAPVFENIHDNPNFSDGISPDSFLVLMWDGGGESLGPGGPYTSEIAVTLRDQEGIIWIDTSLFPPANILNSIVEDQGLREIHPTYSPGCFAVLIGPPCTVAMTGDANDDAQLTSADIIWLVNYVFKSGPLPQPCTATGDTNCSGAITTADIVYLGNHIFRGSPAPCDVCTLSPNTWTCP